MMLKLPVILVSTATSLVVGRVCEDYLVGKPSKAGFHTRHGQFTSRRSAIARVLAGLVITGILTTLVTTLVTHYGNLTSYTVVLALTLTYLHYEIDGWCVKTAAKQTGKKASEKVGEMADQKRSNSGVTSASD